MQHDRFVIRVDGQELADLYPDLLSLVVELDEELAGLCRIRLLLTPSAESWRYLDDPRIAVWKSLEIEGGLEEETVLLFSGYLVQLKPMFGRDVDGAVLELVAMDASTLMDRVDVLKTWPSRKDSDIASEIFTLYGLTPVVDATEVVHDEQLTTVLQRETDIKFLKRLALRNGYECFVHGSSGYFRVPVLDSEPKPALAAHFGPETTIHNVVVDVDAMMPTDVAVYQLSRPDKSVLSVLHTSSEQTAFGASDSAGLLGPGMVAGNRVVGINGAIDATEMQALARGLRDRQTWFVSVSGDVDGNAYGHVLLPRDNVLLKGIGENYSGRYYVSRVVHSFASGGYQQSVQLRRNALQPLGDELFEADAGLLGVLV